MTTTTQMYLTRHRDLLGDIDTNALIRVVGAGSIGSYATLALAKLGFSNIEVWDDGKVEAENIAPQFFTLKDIGKNKVDCLARSIRDLTGSTIAGVPIRLEPGTVKKLAHPAVTISAVDSMQARSLLAFETSYSNFVDARMAIEFLTIISFGNSYTNKDHYQNTLFSDSNSVQEPCTNKAISYTSLIAGGLVAKATLDLLRAEGETQFQTINFDINSFDMIKL